MKLRFLKLMLLLFILPLQMLAAELGVAGKQLAALPGVSNVETLKSTHFPEKYVFFIKQQLDAKDASKGYFEQRVVLCHRGFDRPTVVCPPLLMPVAIHFPLYIACRVWFT